MCPDIFYKCYLTFACNLIMIYFKVDLSDILILGKPLQPKVSFQSDFLILQLRIRSLNFDLFSF